MIRLERLTKSYPTPRGRRYVFRDLDFTFPSGKSIALLGHNGAGKSTLMRLLGGIDTPDSGRVVTQSSISWPMGLSGGFQGSLTARENVQFVCRIYGSSNEDTKARVRYVQYFAEIGDYFDLPMKTLSSGMRSRVSFGLSLAFDFDYYLIDEVMSTGDPSFKAKAKEHFKARMAQSQMILVSHSMPDVREYCQLVVHLHQGQATPYEDIEQGIAAYQQAKRS
ncbi:ABC transporter ATP-binding protein [Roseateles sp. BYS180W]|uniref:ABC transporter ATP-binding protein n=1 Tax=Roseateles rivi TaxID=3299028 RepID=A0ABW7FZE1_9BURK